MKALLATVIAFMASIAIYSQEPYKYLGNYTQPAPNVGSLGKFVDYPVSYYTGTPSISIPIYELQDGAAKTSISLSYHASGIRVAELASSIGLGWALNAGGMITRSVRGGPDDGVFNSGTACGGYYRDSGIRKMPILPYPVDGIMTETPAQSSIHNTFLEQLAAGNADTEPDLYTFNFNGYSGKFVFDENKTVRLLTHQDMKIDVNFQGEFKTWTIVTSDGAKYYFGENDRREVNVISSNNQPDNNTLKPSTWLLTKIIYANSKDTLFFEYDAETYSYFDLGQEYLSIGEDGIGSFQNACAFYGGPPSNVSKTTVSGFRLRKIKSRNYQIVFGVNTSTPRTDLINKSAPYAYPIDSIKVYAASGQCLKQFVLAHQYFQSTANQNVSPMILSVTGGDSTDRRRLKLTSIKEYSGDGTTSKPAYSITYQEAFQLPRRLSYDVDHWGYSNHYGGGANMRFTPSVHHEACRNKTSGANRESKWPDMQQYSIKTLQDPLGVVTTFEFESHTTGWTAPYKTVGGLRIKKIINTDNLTGKSTVRKYEYPQSGILYKKPEYLTFFDNEYFFWTGILGDQGNYRGYDFRYGMLLIGGKRTSQSFVPLQDFQGNHIGYPFVKEIYGDSGQGGHKIYTFFADQNPIANSRLHMSNYTAYASVKQNWVGGSWYGGNFGNGRFNQIPPDSLLYYSYYNAERYYPLAPTQVEFKRGQLVSESTYDSTGSILRQVYYTYQDSFREDLWLRGFMLHRVVTPRPSIAGQRSDMYNDARTYYKLKTGISRLISTYTTDYKDNKVFTTFTVNKYESSFHVNKTGDSTINSSGDTIVTKTYYTPDYANSVTADNVFGKMAARNMILPVATRVWKNGQLLSGTITLYKDFATVSTDTFINPHKIYALETASPMSPATVGETIRMNGKFSTLVPHANFKEQAVFNVNGTTGKIVEQRLLTDKNQALIWDASASLPLAQADNAMFSDIAYSSFETAEKGNWTYAGTPTTDATSPTGTKAYPAASGASKNGLTSSKKYIVSYWYKSGTPSVTGGTQTNSFTGRVVNGWTYRQVTVTGTTSVTIGGTGSIDELRIHPELSQMTSYTYDPLLRLTAMNSPNNTVSYYEYDSMNRVVAIRDQFGNVVKAFEYNYGSSSR